MWIVKEDLVGTHVSIVHRHDDKLLWRAVVRAVGLQQNGFRVVVEIVDVLCESSAWGSRQVGELSEFPLVDEYIMIKPDTSEVRHGQGQ